VAAGDEQDSLVTVVALTDSGGRVYQGRGHLPLRDILAQMGSFTAFDPVIGLSPEQAALIAGPGNTFFRGARALQDDRFSHVVAVNGAVWLVPFHYQTPTLTLCFRAEEATGYLEIHAHVAGYTGYPIDTPDVTEEELEEADPEPLPLLRFPVDLTKHWFVNWHDRDEAGNLVEAPAGHPVVFEAVAGESAAVNPLIKYLEGI